MSTPTVDPAALARVVEGASGVALSPADAARLAGMAASVAAGLDAVTGSLFDTEPALIGPVMERLAQGGQAR